MSDVFVFTFQKQFVETNTRHKNLIKALNEKHASRELLSLNFIYKEKCSYLQNERV